MDLLAIDHDQPPARDVYEPYGLPDYGNTPAHQLLVERLGKALPDPDRRRYLQPGEEMLAVGSAMIC
jgi:hypothetical protein